MAFIYYLIVKAYGLVILFASPFNKKARLWITGRANWHKKLKSALNGAGENRIHFHCPSLGEYEQGKPVLEALRKSYPDYFILLTFYSPSGYEIKKDDNLADHVCYLPLDGPLNALRFVRLLKPKLAFFVKYDFWHFFIKAYHSNKIPILYISSVFRNRQVFFKWYGKFFRKMLYRVNHFFVQDQESLEVMYKHSINHLTVSGDTRFDRVFKNYQTKTELPAITEFIENKKIFIAGSTWPADESLLKDLIESTNNDWRFIIAPHEISGARINKLKASFSSKSIKYSECGGGKMDFKILIIDNIGLLSSLYSYADISYIGGGFGRGIHNILEAAVFGTPVIFGPKYKKFREAKNLIKLGGAVTINNLGQLESAFNSFANDSDTINSIKIINTEYINNNRGATKIIMHYINMNIDM